MGRLNPVDLDAVLVDLKVVVDSTMLLGGEVIDFKDPYGAMPVEHRRATELLDAEHNKRIDSLPSELMDDSYFRPQGPDSYMGSRCDAAWDNLNASLRRLDIMLESGDVEYLDCPVYVVNRLRTIWGLLQELKGTKPVFTPGKPDPLWAFTAKLGTGMFLRDAVEFLKQEISERSSDVQPSHQHTITLSPLQQNILTALDGKALKKQQLADVVCAGEGSRLYRPGGIKDLKDAGLVAHKNGVGFYRPDAPPDGLVVDVN